MQIQINNNRQPQLNGDDTEKKWDDSTILLDCLVRLLKPPSPQPAHKQIALFSKYFQLINSDSNNRPTGPICLDWIRPFVDSQRIATFPGLGLTSAVYGESAPPQNPFLMANFPPIEGTLLPHPVFPSNGVHLRIWKELLDCAFQHSNQSKADDLFLNEHSENLNDNFLPFMEPLTVRIRIQNPFPFQLFLSDLRLSINKVKRRSSSLIGSQLQPQFQQSMLQISTQNVQLAATLNEPLDWQTEEGGAQSHRNLPEISFQSVDLQVLPSCELEQFEVNGIHFHLQIPALPAKEHQNEGETAAESVGAFVPIQVQGRRLFNAKEQRISKMYSPDTRLQFTVQSEPSPLMAFRPAGGDPQMIRSITQNIVVEACAGQILQIVFEVENIGQIPLYKMTICSNWPEQVSLSEPNPVMTTQRWSTCPMEVHPSSLANEPFPLEAGLDCATQLGLFRCQFISGERPLLGSHKTGIRIAIRAWPDLQDEAQLFYFHFLYSSPNGQSRQFCYAVPVRCTQCLVSASLRQLNPSCGLNVLNLLGASSTFSKLELIRLSAIYCHAPEEMSKDQQEKRGKIHWKSACSLRALNNKTVEFECDQSLSLCFFAVQLEENSSSTSDLGSQPASANQIEWTDLWLSQPTIPDIPVWHLAVTAAKSHQNQSGSNNEQMRMRPTKGCSPTATDDEKPPILVLRLLWKASLVRNDGTVGTLFSEMLVSSDEENANVQNSEEKSSPCR